MQDGLLSLPSMKGRPSYQWSFRKVLVHRKTGSRKLGRMRCPIKVISVNGGYIGGKERNLLREPRMMRRVMIQ